MATKPSTLPRPWATNAVYATGPFAGQPGKVDPGLGVAAEGHRPGANDPTAAEHENYQQNLVTASWIPWVNSGSSAGAADAHIVETTAAGRTSLRGLSVTDTVDETAVSIIGASTGIIPSVSMTNTGNATVLDIRGASDAAGNALNVTMVDAMTGYAIGAFGSDTSIGEVVHIEVPAGSSSRGLYVFSESSTEAAAYIRAADAGVALEVIGGGTDALQVTAGSGQIAVDITGSATGVRALRVTGSNTYCIQGIAGSGGTGALLVGTGTGHGADIQGGTTPGAYGARIFGQSNTGHAIYAATDPTSTTAVRVGYFEALGSAAGLELVAPANHALIITPDITAPVYGSIFQNGAMNAAPTTQTSGQLSYVSSTFDAWMHSSFADGAWRAMWSSLGGFCYGAQTNQIVSNASTAAYSVLCTVAMTGTNAPKLAGQKVRITATIRAGLSVATACTLDVQVRDTTAGTTLISQVGTGLTTADGYYMPAVATTFTTTAVIDFEYTIPTAGARTFVLEFKHDIGAITVTAQGSMVVTGSYS
jgi:hypothetical protein